MDDNNTINNIDTEKETGLTAEQQAIGAQMLEDMESGQTAPTPTPTSESMFESEEFNSFVDNEIELEKKYGDKYIQAAGLGAARGLSFGLSDQILKKYLGEERLREIKNRNKVASYSAEIAATIAPLVATGGTGAIAKGAQIAGSGVLGVTKAGLAVEKVTAAGLKKILGKEANEKALAKILEKTVPAAMAGATEGALFSVGQLISEDALGEVEFNGENLLSNMGTGVMFGGAVGGLVGVIPGATKAALKTGKSAFDEVSSKLKVVDPEEAAFSLLDASASSRVYLKNNAKDVVDELPTKLHELHVKHKFKDAEGLYSAVKSEIKEHGEMIGSLTKKMDDAGAASNSADVWIRVADDMDNRIAKIEDNVTLKNQTRELKAIRNKALENAASGKPLDASEVFRLKNQYAKAGKVDKPLDSLTEVNKANLAISDIFRKELIGFSDQVGGELGQQWAKANKAYRFASTIEEFAAKKANKPTRLADISDLLTLIAAVPGGITTSVAGLGLKKFYDADTRRLWVITRAMQKQQEKNIKHVETAVKTFSSGKRVAAPVTTKAILASPLSNKNEEGKKPQAPKNKKEAFNNLKENIRTLKSDPEKMVERIAKSTYTMNLYAPKSTQVAIEKGLKAIDFLESKIPTSRGNLTGFPKFDREYMPSSIELAKFERYVETVENPMSVMDDLAAGTLTREQAETLQVVFPKIYEHVQKVVMEEVSKPDTKLDYNQKIQLGILLNVPTDNSLAPKTIQKLQAMFQQDPQQSQSGTQTTSAVNPTVGGLQKADFSGRVMTDTQRVSSRT